MIMSTGGSVEPTDSRSEAGSLAIWSLSRRSTRQLSVLAVPASGAGSSERQIPPMRSARQLAAQAAFTPPSAPTQTPTGVPGWLLLPGWKRVPIQNVFPDDNAPCPTVG